MKSLLILFASILLATNIPQAHAQLVPVEWALRIGSTNQDSVESIAVDASGNCIVFGTYNIIKAGPCDFGETNLPPIGGRDMFLAKYSGSGNLDWVRSIGGTNSDFVGSMTIHTNGDIFICGRGSGGSGPVYLGTNTLSSGNFVACYHGDGSLKWARMYSPDAAAAQRIAIDATGSLFIVGTFSSSTMSFGGIVLTNIGSPSTPDIYIAKLDSSGNLLWATRAGELVGVGFDSVNGLGVDASQNVYVSIDSAGSPVGFGSFAVTNSTARRAVYVAKYSSSGNLLWVKKMTSAGTGYQSTMTVDLDGTFYIGGQFLNTVMVGADVLTNANTSTTHAFIAKADSNGNVLWAIGSRGTNTSIITGLAFDETGNVYVTGSYRSDWAFAGGTLAAIGLDYAAFVLKLDSLGILQWIYSAASANGGGAFGDAITIDPEGNTFVAGRFSWEMSFAGTNFSDHTQAGDVYLFKGPRPPPRISAQPQDRNANVGGTVTFSVTADGEPPLIYQWLFNGSPLLDATNATLTLTNTTHTQAGFYSVIVSNASGSVTSRAAQLLFNFLTVNMYAGLTIDGETGQTFQVQYVSELGPQTNWQSLMNVTLTNAPQLFIDVQSPGVPRRFYRAISFP